MILPSGAYVQFIRHGTHRDCPTNTIHVVDFWASEEDFKSGKPGIRWDATLHWNGPQDPGPRLVRHLDEQVPHALRPPPAGMSHFDVGILPLISDKPDVHGILAHPSMAAFRGTLA